MSETVAATSSEGSGKGPGARLIRAGQIVGAITALITAAVLAWNALKPAPPPAVLRATVTNIQAHSGRTLYDYLNSHPAQLAHVRALYRAQGLGEEEIGQALQKPGILAEFTISTQGPAGRAVKLTRTLYDAHTEARIPEGGGVIPAEKYVSHAGSYQTTESTWIQPPAGGGSYFLEVDLVDAGGATLATGRSQTFRAPKT
jgi:hypothetical protein